MLIEDNKIVHHSLFGQFLAYIQHKNFLSITGLLGTLFDESTLVWSFTFCALWSLKLCIPFPCVW